MLMMRYFFMMRSIEVDDERWTRSFVLIKVIHYLLQTANITSNDETVQNSREFV